MEKQCIWSETGTKSGVGYSYAQYFMFNDGGRSNFGFKGTTGDCVTRAIAIATGMQYKDVYDNINDIGKTEKTSKKKTGKSSARTGVYKNTIRNYMKSIGWDWHPTMKIGSGCTTHLRGDELPTGNVIASVSKHLVAVIDGVINDISDCSRQGTRCVYGYYIKSQI